MNYEAALGEDDDAVRFLLARGLNKQAVSINRLGVVTEDCLPEHRRFIGWLAIPYLGLDGRPVQVRFRCLRNHEHMGHGKYMTMEGDPARVYNVQSLIEADFDIHVTEGEIDAMVLSMLGYPAVAIPGASGFQSHHRRMLAGFGRVFVWGDPDEAGAQFASRITRMMGQAISVRLDVGDVNETYVTQGEAAIHAALAKSIV
jgi:DNA primase